MQEILLTKMRDDEESCGTMDEYINKEAEYQSHLTLPEFRNARGKSREDPKTLGRHLGAMRPCRHAPSAKRCQNTTRITRLDPDSHRSPQRCGSFAPRGLHDWPPRCLKNQGDYTWNMTLRTSKKYQEHAAARL